ncbi:hypothetical protein MXB_3753, partial [Myxobolus squamalis]
FETDLDRTGPLAILEHFNTIYTATSEEFLVSIKNHAIKLIEIGVIKDLLNEGTLDIEEKNQHRNCLKALCSLICSVIIGKLKIAKKPTASKCRGRSKKIDTPFALDNLCFGHCEKFLEFLIELFSFSLYIASDPKIDNKFLFQTPGKCNDITVQHVENQALPMSNLVELVVTKYSFPQILIQLFKELAQTHSNEMIIDSASSRNCAQFISTLGRQLPKEVLGNCSILMCHLELDPYSMRNAVLDCFGQIVIQVYTKLELDDVGRKSRDCFLEKLQEHLHDVNAYVRSHVLQIWVEISEKKSIPLLRYNTLTCLIVERLRDKSCNVRKNAASLLLTLIINNPYSPFLSAEELEKQLTAEGQKLKSISDVTSTLFENSERDWNNIEIGLKSYLYKSIIEDHSPGEIDVETEILSEENRKEIISFLLSGKFESALIAISIIFKLESESELLKQYSSNDLIRFFKTLFLEYVSHKIINAELQNQNIKSDVNEENQANITVANYLKDALSFSRVINSSMGTIYRLLQSDTVSDIIEIVQLIVTTYKFGISRLGEVMDRILPLVWSTEVSLKAAVVEALSQLLMFTHTKSSTDTFIENIFKILPDASIAVLSALDELIFSLAEKDSFPSNTISLLWRLYSNTELSISRRTQAAILLGMISKGQPTIIWKNLELISYQGFAIGGDIKLAIASGSALLAYYSVIRKTTDDLYKHKLENNHTLFRKNINFVCEKFNDTSSLWSPLCEFCIKTIVSFSNRPFELLNEFLALLLSKIQLENIDGSFVFKNFLEIGRLIHAVSHTAVSILILLEGDFLSEIKRRSNVIHSMKISKHKRKSTNQNSTITEQGEDDVNGGGATADDTEVDFVKDLCEHEILHCENIFSKFIPLIRYIIDHHTIFPSDLVSVAALSLSKLMLLSSSFCSENLQLMFTLLKKSAHENVRHNCVIIVGDIIQRFPNLVEPWMSNILRDESVTIRKDVLAVLSSLILNDMVKVKGHISELALCIEDSDPVISARTRLFFQELSRKDNAIYNILPDIISRLSDARDTLDRNLFERVMKFLLKFLQKEKQCESLVDKLCNRFALTKNSNEILDIIYCLSQLNLGERSFKKLIENFQTYKDKIHDNQVYEGLFNVITKFKKSARDEVKATIEEFEKRMSEAHSRGLNEDHGGSFNIKPSPLNEISQMVKEVSRIASPDKSTKLMISGISQPNSILSSRKRTRTTKKILSFGPEDSES